MLRSNLLRGHTFNRHINATIRKLPNTPVAQTQRLNSSVHVFSPPPRYVPLGVGEARSTVSSVDGQRTQNVDRKRNRNLSEPKRPSWKSTSNYAGRGGSWWSDVDASWRLLLSTIRYSWLKRLRFKTPCWEPYSVFGRWWFSLYNAAQCNVVYCNYADRWGSRCRPACSSWNLICGVRWRANQIQIKHDCRAEESHKLIAVTISVRYTKCKTLFLTCVCVAACYTHTHTHQRTLYQA